MEAMWIAFWAWIGWNVLPPLAGSIFIAFVIMLCHLPGIVRRMRCQHPHFFETRSCDAVCIDCHKNLGFIGSVREQRKALSGEPL